MSAVEPLETIATPALLLDRTKLDANIARMSKVLAGRARLRPHLKTCKSVEVAHHLPEGLAGPITVSTLAEAEGFAAAGARDILYAVSLAPSKLDRVLALRTQGVDLAVIVDSLVAANAVSAAAKDAGTAVPTLIEVDCDGSRSGVSPDDPAAIVAIGKVLAATGSLRGVMTHSSRSYAAISAAEVEPYAERERAAAVDAAGYLRAAGVACPTVSVGSTPTALFGRSFDGVTEVRAGVFMFNDLVMAGVGACTYDRIALSVLASVIGRHDDRATLLIDAGWMALSRDRGTERQPIDQGYGLVCDLAGTIYPDVLVTSTSQEHGTIQVREGSAGTLPPLRPGDRVRILPNHACATAAQHDHYVVIENGTPIARWNRLRGW